MSELRLGIIGGGIIGTFTAYYLAQKGYDVTVFDSQTDLPSASYGNAGMICPSHFIPLAAPGIIKTSIKWMLDSKSPLLFRPYWDANFIKWCFTFFKNASTKNVVENVGLMSGLLEWSKDIYLDLEKSNIITSIQKEGIVMYCNTKHALHEELDMARTAKRLGIETREVTNADMIDLNPGVQFNGVGGVQFTGDMHVDPAGIMTQLQQYLSNKTVRFIQEEVVKMYSSKNKIDTLITNKSEYKIEGVIIASGVLSGAVSDMFGENNFIQGGKGYNITIENVSPQLKTPLILVEGRVALTPMNKKLRLGGTMEIGKYNHTVNLNRIQGILENTEKYLPDYKKSDLEKIKPWYGYRPLTNDGMPLIKKLHNWDNAFINAGHGMLGLSLAPASGLLMEQIISNTLASA